MKADNLSFKKMSAKSDFFPCQMHSFIGATWTNSQKQKQKRKFATKVNNIELLAFSKSKQDFQLKFFPGYWRFGAVYPKLYGEM